MTNWAYIRSLTREEFKDWLMSVLECCRCHNCFDCPIDSNNDKGYCDCIAIYDWLREQSEE